MALAFPSNPTQGQTYQTGSSAEYTFNGSYWEITQPPTATTLNAVSSSYAVRSGVVIEETVTITSNVTAPTKGSTTVDQAILVDHGNGLCTFTMNYYQSTAGTAGSGDYLFQLPAGYQFDTAYHGTRGTAGDPNQNAFEAYIPGGTGMMQQNGAITSQGIPMVWDSNKFRLIDNGYRIFGPPVGWRTPASSAYFTMSAAGIGFKVAFTFKKA